MAEPERCFTCRYWHRNDDDDDEEGECRVRPPAINPTVAALYFQELELDNDEDPTPQYIAQQGWFPLTSGNEWCGEHQPREETSSEREVSSP